MAARPQLGEEEAFTKPYNQRIMSRLVRFLWPFKLQLLLALFLMVVMALANLAGPYLVKTALDSYIAKGDLDGLRWVVMLYLLSGLTSLGAGFAHDQVASWIGHNLVFHVRVTLFSHLQRLGLGFYDKQEMGRLMSRVQSDVGVLNELLTWGTVGIFGSIFTLVGIVIVMFSINTPLSLLAFAVLPFIAIITFTFRPRVRAAYRGIRLAIAKVNANLQENISGVRVVQSFSREVENLRRFQEVNRAHLKAHLRTSALSNTFWPSVDLMAAIATGLVIWYGGTLALHDQLTPGTLVAFVLYVNTFYAPITTLSYYYQILQSAMASGERIFELLDTQPAIVDAPDAVELPPIRGEVKFEKVDFRYDGGPLVLKEFSLEIKPGQTVALVGATGAGKSSTINLMPRFYDIAAGRILIDGYDVRRVKLLSLRRQMSIVPQDPFLFSGTVRDNIRYGRLEATEEEIVAAAKATNVHEFVSAMSFGYDTDVGQRGTRLSGGERQLVCFARALIADPRILILDEATSSIDTRTEQLVQEALRRLLQGRTSLVIAHRLSTIKDADLVVVIDQGRIVERGTHEELLAKRGHYYKLYTMQFLQQERIPGGLSNDPPTGSQPVG